MKSSPEITPEALLAHSDWVRRLVTGLVMDPGRAEDVLQETWLVALEHPPKVDRDLRAWLAVVARNTIRNFARGEGRRKRREEVAARVDALPDTVDVIAKARMQGRMVEAVLALDEPYRTTVLLRYFEELPPREIAKRLGRPVNTVHSHIARGLERLRGELDAEYGDREAWGMAFLPLLHRGSVPAAHGSLLLKAGGWIVLMKWMLPIAAGIVALFLWGERGGEGVQLDNEGALLEELSSGIGGVGPERPREVEVASDSKREQVEEELPATASGALPVLANHLTGRVVDLEGRALPDLRLRVQDPNRPQFRDGWLGVGDRSVDLDTELRRILSEHPEGIEQVLPGVEDPEQIAAFLAGAVTQPVRLVTDASGVFSAQLEFEDGEVSCEDPRFSILGHGELRPVGGEPERIYVVAPVEPLEGRVVGAGGVALAGVRITSGLGLDGIPGFPMNLSSSAGYRNWSATSDDGGVFRFEAFPVVPGMRLSTEAEGYRDLWYQIEQADRPFLELVLEPEAVPPRVTGRVFDERGMPVEDARVVFGQYETRTGAQGAFALELEYLPREEPIVALRSGSRPAMIEGLGARLKQDPTCGLDLVLRLGPPTSSIKGQVVNSGGEPLPGIDLYLLGAQTFGTTSSSVESMLAGSWRETFTSDSDGRFEIGGLFQENYDVVACDPRSYLAVRAAGVRTGVEDLRLVLDERSRIPRLRGRVVDRHGRGVADARLSSNLTTSAPRGGASRSWKTLELGRSDAEGRFELHDVPSEAVSFGVGGTGIENTEVELSEFDGAELVVVVGLELRFQLEAGVTTEAESFEVVDEAGTRVNFWARSPGVNSWVSRYRLAKREGLPTFEVSDSAVELVLYRAEKELRRIPLDLRRGEIVRLR